MKISIHDYANNRVIISNVPHYLSEANISSDDIALTILIALGLKEDECDYMICDFEVENILSLEQLTQNFKEDALEALAELAD